MFFKMLKSNLRNLPQNGVFAKTTKRFFKNKLTLSHQDLEIVKQANYLKINVVKSEEANFKKKAFIFDNKTNIDTIISKMELEYDLSFVLSKELKDKLENILKKENVLTQKEIDINYIKEILGIAKQLNISPSDTVEFVKQIMSKSDLEVNNEKHLKILYFNITQELQRMEKVKKRTNEVVSRRVTFILLILTLILIVQTGVFYHMIFNVDHLGWDLVEPATFLFGSIVFVLGVFSYVKLHKNAVSGERLFQDFRKGFLLRRYVRDNFNYDKYNSLNTQLNVLKRLMKDSQKI